LRLSILFLTLFFARAAAFAGNNTALDAARRALAEGVPEVAAEKLRESLRSPTAQPANAEERRATLLLLTRALLAANDPASALATAELIPPLASARGFDLEAVFWRAQALAALGRWSDAEPAYAQVARADNITNAATPEETADISAARFGYARALLALGRREEARRAFEECERDDPARRASANLRLSALALQDGRLDEAAARLDANAAAAADSVSETPAQAANRRLLRARLAFAQKDFAAADNALAALEKNPVGLNERRYAAAVFLHAEVRAARNDAAGAAALLTDFLQRYPRSVALTEAFSRLTALATPLAANSKAALPVMETLAPWQHDTTAPERQARAALALARLRHAAGDDAAAETALAEFASDGPLHGAPGAVRLRALLDLAAVRLLRNEPAAAQKALAETEALLPATTGTTAAATVRTERDLLAARVRLAQRDFAGAARTFETVAARGGPLAASALRQAALTLLEAGDERGYAAMREKFETQFPSAPHQEEFMLDEGLMRVARVLSQNDSPADDHNNGSDNGRETRAAAATLRQFLKENPHSARTAEARLALAELALLRGGDLPASLNEARRQLAYVSNPGEPQNSGNNAAPAAAPTVDPATAERADFLALWLADAPGPTRDETAAIAAANRFLARWPHSPRVAEARLKLGEIYFRRDDYTDAQTQLELIGREGGTVAPSLYEHARYLAGLAALRGLSETGADRALSLFEDAAQVNGVLKTAARLRQAETLRDRLGQPADALRIYDGLLTAPPDSTTTDSRGSTAATPPATAASNSTSEAPSATTLPNEARCEALCGRGETLLLLGRRGEAAAAFADLAALPGASAAWRQQALARRGEALEKSGDTAAALVAYHDALDVFVAAPPTASPPAVADAPPTAAATVTVFDLTWFYRAGFAAARILKNESRWASAAAIYARLAAVNGPLKAEAEQQLNQLRLEHFLWPE